MDTRGANGPIGGPILAAGTPRSFPITGYCSVPTAAKAVTVNVTMVGPTAQGFLKIWPYSTTAPMVSSINADVGEIAIANSVYVPLTTDPSFNLTVSYGTAGGGTTHVLIDVTGYFQ